MSRQRILVADDDPCLLGVVSMFLSKIEGYEVVTAADGQEAMEAISQHRPDLVILDIMMPGLDGLETCRRLKADPATQSLPVLLFTALDRDEDVEAGRLVGADDFIRKPSSLADLARTIRGFLGDPLSAAS